MMIAFPSCCCGAFAIAIYNSNAVTDDNFRVLLNGTEIGTINNNQSAFTGRIFTANDGEFSADKFGPVHPNSFQQTVRLNEALLVNGQNTLRLENTQVNGAGNFGAVKIGYWQMDAVANGYFDLITTLLSDSYGLIISGLGSGLGSHEDFKFNFP